MKTRLIINADDYGLTDSVTQAIQALLQNRSISSTSVMANLVNETELDRLSQITDSQGTGVGVHLNLTLGRALTNRSSLTDPEGVLLDYPILRQRLSRGKVKYAHIQAEIDAQITRLNETGLPLSHIDSHQHVHAFPQVFWALCSCAQKAKITRMRTHRKWLVRSQKKNMSKSRKHPLTVLRSATIPYAYAILAKKWGIIQPSFMVEHTDSPWKTSIEKWQIVLRNLPNASCEIFIHPGYKSPELSRLSRYVEEREQEYFALISDTVEKTLNDASVQLISYNEL